MSSTDSSVASRAAQGLRRELAEVLHAPRDSEAVDFLLSSLTETNPFYDTDDILAWLDGLNGEQYFDVSVIPLSELRGWGTDPATGDLCHGSGKFFSIRGIEVTTNRGNVRRWTQPVIDQPEIGVLGILVQRMNGILYFLMQAKAEPGNVNTFQLSPTVQATRSNFTRVHGGKATPFLEYFLDESRGVRLVDQLQSEQGARFLRKRNRNMIVRVPDDERIDLPPSFRWMTLGQLKRAAVRDNTVNMDSRSVLSGICYDPDRKTSAEPISLALLARVFDGHELVASPADRARLLLLSSAHGNSPARHTDDELLRQVTAAKFGCELQRRVIPLRDVDEWEYDGESIRHKQGQFFRVLGVRVAASNREVPGWDQPIVQQVDQGIVGGVLREIDGELHLLTQLKLESGNLDLLEIAPTVQCITGSYETGRHPPFVAGLLERLRESPVFVDALQSEEGGRFFREQNRNVIMMGDATWPDEDPPFYLWVSIRQCKSLLKYSNILNVEIRSLLSLML